MIKRKKNSGKTGGLFGKKGRASVEKKPGSMYTLELLESRVLLSADLAGAVQVMPMQPAQAPTQATILNVPAGQTGTQQSFSVAEMLAKSASSFHQYAGEPRPAGSNAVHPALDSVVSEGSKTHGGHHISTQQNPAVPQLVTPAAPPPSSSPQGSANVITGNASSLQPAPVPPIQSPPTQIATSVLQSDVATTPPIVQSPVSQTPPQPAPIVSPVSQGPTPSVAPTVVSSSVVSADTSLPPPAPVSQTQLQPTPQAAVTAPLSVVAAPVSDAQTLPISQTTTPPVPSTPQLSNDLSQSQTVSQPLVTPVQTATASPVQSVQAPPATVSVTQPVSSSSQDAVASPVSQPIPATSSTPPVPITTSTNISTVTSDAINPTLPQATVDTSMPTTSVTVRVGPHGDYTDLQTALNSVSLGTTILLEPGVAYTSPNSSGFILPNKTTGTGWIVIRPDMPDSALPVTGTNLSPTDSVMMPKILRGAVNNYAISVAPGAHNYRIIGVELMNQGNLDTQYNGAFVNLDGMESSISAQSNHIILDRVYIHGPSASGSVGVKFGVVLGGQYQAVINSTIEDLHSNDGEAKAIAGWDGAGPWLITNNFLSASGENILIGGATPLISGLTPSDIEITHNHFYKPLAWRDDPAYTSGPNAVVTKNLLELKNAQRVLIDASLFENVWPDAQTGFAVVLTPRGGGSTGSDAWTTVSDITISNNTFLNVANGLAISGGGPTIALDQGGPTQHGAHFLIENNVFVGLGGDYSENYTSGNFATIGMGPSDLQIKHNTIVSYAGTGSRGTTLSFTYGLSDEGGLFPLNHFVLQDNIFAARNNPMKLGSAANLDTLMPGYIWTNNVFAGPWPTITGWTAAMMPQGNGNSYPASLANVGYVDIAAGNYNLSLTSPYKGAASDGTDIGVNWNQFNAANS